MHFWRSNSTLDSLKRVFNVFRRKPSLGAPVLLVVLLLLQQLLIYF